MPQETFEEALDRWVKLSAELARVKREEMELRNQLFGAAFQNPKEGTNKLILNDGREFVGKHNINRSVDAAQVPTVVQEIAKLGKNDVVADDYFKVKYDLAVGLYKKAPPEVKLILTRAVTEKPGSPSIEIR